MKIIHTEDFQPSDEDTNLFVYNGLDTCLTYEIYQKLLPLLDEDTKVSYRWSFASQSLALEMMFRGLRVDREFIHKRLHELQTEYEKYNAYLQRLAHAVWDADLNPNSPAQLKALFYETFGLEEIRFRGKVSTDRKSLEKLIPKNLYIRPIAKLILLLHDLGKLISVLQTEIDPDGRMRCSYSVAGTETGRWNSTANAFNTGTNMQNITNKLRELFVADPGRKMAYIDLQAAESKGVGYISGDPAYIKACDEGDAHTVVCRLVWPELPWTGDLAHDKKLASSTPFYRENSYRDMGKRGGHGTNYCGQPPTMAVHLKMPVEVVAHFQQEYFKAFPKIAEWHERVRDALQLKHCLVTCFQRKRVFFGRPSDASTLREAVAFEPQSTIADTANFGGWLVQQRWHGGLVRCLAQLHDAILVDYPEELEDELIPEIIKTATIHTPIHGRVMTINLDCETGWNWAHADENNPDGMQRFRNHDDRKRTHIPEDNVLNWKLD